MDQQPKEKHEHKPLLFPEGFLWGAAGSAHQVEGDNIYNDWWEYELNFQPPNFRSGHATDQYHKYEKDFDLAQKLNQNAHRLSIEWSRIEPKKGQFRQSEIDHYKKVLEALKIRGLKVMLTLWHFTLPKWLSDEGGWENPKAVEYFLIFLKKVVPEVKDYVDLWITQNEPGVYVYMGYLMGAWPPLKKDKISAINVYWNLAQAHKKAYKLIHHYQKDAKVGIAHNAASFSHLHHHSIREAIAVWGTDVLENHSFFVLTGKKTHDFLGINYYFNKYVSFNRKDGHLPKFLDIGKSGWDVSDMGWEIYPQGIFEVLMDFSDYNLPIYITENGLASTNDDRRCRFLTAYLQEIYHALTLGVDVKGYFHWSLTDNFEWTDGFGSRFGLVEIDYKTLERKPRPSAYVYADIIAHNGIPHTLLRFLGHTVRASEVLEMDHSCPEELCPHKKT